MNDTNFQLLYEYFPELLKTDLKKTHLKQWHKFLGAFAELVLWVHCSRSAHHAGHGIVLFPSWWNKHLPNHQRWHFNVEAELSPYLLTNGEYNYNKGLAREWIPDDNFKSRAAALISDPRFKTSNQWRGVIESVIGNTLEVQEQHGFIHLPNIPIDIKPDTSLESFMVVTAFADKLLAGCPMTYTVSNTGRLHHPLQNIKREHRVKLFDGWYSYDFKACAPTVLAQEYHNHVPNSSLPNIEIFIQNREEIRKEIAIHTGVTEITVKRALTGLFFGQTVPTERQARWDIASTSSSDKYKFSLINSFGPVVTEKLLANPVFSGIVEECQYKMMKEMALRLKEMATLEDGVWRLMNRAGGIKNMMRWNSRQAVAHWYFGWERVLIDIASAQLDEIDANYLLIHDGWLSNKRIDVTKLTNEIYQKTGLIIGVEEKDMKEGEAETYRQYH